MDGALLYQAEQLNLDTASKRLAYPMPVYDSIDLVSDSLGIES